HAARRLASRVAGLPGGRLPVCGRGVLALPRGYRFLEARLCRPRQPRIYERADLVLLRAVAAGYVSLADSNHRGLGRYVDVRAQIERLTGALSLVLEPGAYPVLFHSPGKAS